MVIVGGSSARYYRCGDAHKRGTCKNRLPIREDVISTALLDELRALLTCPKGIEHARASLVHDIAQMGRRRDKDEQQVEAQLRVVENELERTFDFIAKNDLSETTGPATRDKLEKQCAQKELLQRQLDALRTRSKDPVPLPTPEGVQKAVFEIEKLLRADATRAREALRTMLKDGIIELEPQADGTYIARGTVFPLMPLLLQPLEKPKPRDQAVAGLRVVYLSSCAGSLPHSLHAAIHFGQPAVASVEPLSPPSVEPPSVVPPSGIGQVVSGRWFTTGGRLRRKSTIS